MRYLIIFFLALVLISCFIYSSKDDCIYGITSTQSYSLGYTDPKQRWDDLVSCGVKLGDVTLHSAWRKALEPLNKELLEKLSAKFRACMKNKGYITIDSCGRKNSTTDKGLCNE